MRPLDRLLDDDVRRAIVGLDQVRIGLADLEAAPILNDLPGIQWDIHEYARVVRRAADLLARLRDRSR